MNYYILKKQLEDAGFNKSDINKIERISQFNKLSQIKKTKQTFEARKMAGLLIGRPAYKPTKLFKIITTFQTLGFIGIDMALFILDMKKSTFYKYKRLVGTDEESYEKFYKEPTDAQVNFYKNRINKYADDFIQRTSKNLKIHDKEDLKSNIKIMTFLKISNLESPETQFKRMVNESGYEALNIIMEEIRERNAQGNKIEVYNAITGQSKNKD